MIALPTAFAKGLGVGLAATESATLPPQLPGPFPDFSATGQFAFNLI